MAVHAFTGVTGKITVSGSVVGFVSGDLSLAVAINIALSIVNVPLIVVKL